MVYVVNIPDAVIAGLAMRACESADGRDYDCLLGIITLCYCRLLRKSYTQLTSYAEGAR